MRIDLNADLGEGIGDEAALLKIVSSASIACGGHAGDAQSIAEALRGCRARSVRAGAHPGFADRANFGRQRLALSTEALIDSIAGQLHLILAVAREEQVPVTYVKLHGALANMAAEDLLLARTLFGVVRDIDDRLAILALDRSAQVDAALALGLPVIREAYADRGYQADGLLVPRNEPGAVLHDADAILARAVRLARHGEIVATDGSVFRTEARSLCIHGDNPEAVAIAEALKAGLAAQGIAVGA